MQNGKPIANPQEAIRRLNERVANVKFRDASAQTKVDESDLHVIDAWGCLTALWLKLKTMGGLRSVLSVENRADLTDEELLYAAWVQQLAQGGKMSEGAAREMLSNYLIRHPAELEKFFDPRVSPGTAAQGSPMPLANFGEARSLDFNEASARAEFHRDRALQAEFGEVGTYLAFREAEAKGLVGIFSRR